MTLNSLVAGCNQKSSRDPITNLSEARGAGSARRPQAPLAGLRRQRQPRDALGAQLPARDGRAGAVGRAAGPADAARAADGRRTAHQQRALVPLRRHLLGRRLPRGTARPLRGKGRPAGRAAAARAGRARGALGAPAVRPGGRDGACAGGRAAAAASRPALAARVAALEAEVAQLRATVHGPLRRNSACHHLDTPKRTTVLKLPTASGDTPWILAFTPEEQKFREEVRAWVRENLPQDIAHKVHNALHLTRDDMQRWAKILGKKGWLGYGWPKQFGGPGWTAVQKHLFEEEMRAGRRAAHRALRPGDGGAGDHGLRLARAAEALPARHRQRRSVVEPGLQRTGLGLRPGLAQDPRRAQGRQVHRQRPEDLDHAGAVRRMDLLPGAHRPPKASRRPASPSC